MIRERRQVHRGVFTVLMVLMPVLLIAGLLLRPETPPASQVEGRLADAAGFSSSSSVPSPSPPHAGTADSYPFEISVDERSGEEPVLTIRPTAPIFKPDVLVYWTASGEGSGLPEDAILVGGLSEDLSQTLTLPRAAAGARGAILVYSLPYQEILARIPMTQVDGGAGAEAPRGAAE